MKYCIQCQNLMGAIHTEEQAIEAMKDRDLKETSFTITAASAGRVLQRTLSCPRCNNSLRAILVVVPGHKAPLWQWMALPYKGGAKTPPGHALQWWPR